MRRLFVVFSVVPALYALTPAEKSAYNERKAASRSGETVLAAPYFWDFEANDGGFTVAGGEWEWGAPTWGPGGAYSGSNCWATILAADYSNNANATLTGPTLDISAWTVASLEFVHWFSTESGYDTCRVDLSSDGGGTWTQVAVYAGTGTAWSAETLNATPYISNQFTFRFRFTSDGSVTYPGWYLDDVGVDSVLGTVKPTGDPVIISTDWLTGYIDNSSTEAGTYTASTCCVHPFGPGLTMLYGWGNPWSTYLTVRSRNTQTDWVTRSSGSTSFAPYTTQQMQPYYNGIFYQDPARPDTVVSIWTLPAPDNLTVRQYSAAEGLGNTSRLRFTTVVINTGSSTRTVDIRYQWDTHVSTTDSPYLRRHDCTSFLPWTTVETAYTGAAIPCYTQEAVDQVPSIYHYISNTWSPWNPPATPPDTLIYAGWSVSYSNSFGVPWPPADAIGLALDDAVDMFWLNRVIPPGDSVSVTEYLWAQITPVEIGVGESEPRLRLSLSGGLLADRAVRLTLPDAARVVLTLFSADGRVAETLADGRLSAGEHTFGVGGLAAGAYLLRLQSPTGVESRVVVLPPR